MTDDIETNKRFLLVDFGIQGMASSSLKPKAIGECPELQGIWKACYPEGSPLDNHAYIACVRVHGRAVWSHLNVFCVLCSCFGHAACLNEGLGFPKGGLIKIHSFPTSQAHGIDKPEANRKHGYPCTRNNT